MLQESVSHQRTRQATTVYLFTDATSHSVPHQRKFVYFASWLSKKLTANSTQTVRPLPKLTHERHILGMSTSPRNNSHSQIIRIIRIIVHRKRIPNHTQMTSSVVGIKTIRWHLVDMFIRTVSSWWHTHTLKKTANQNTPAKVGGKLVNIWPEKYPTSTSAILLCIERNAAPPQSKRAMIRRRAIVLGATLFTCCYSEHTCCGLRTCPLAVLDPQGSGNRNGP